MSTRTLTILLADLVGSSAHVVAIPQAQAVDYLQDAILPIRQAVEEHGGSVIKFTGDGYLATFESVKQALRAAERIRHFFLHQKYSPSGIALDGVRIILNTADVTVQDNDILGDAVAAISRLEKNVPTNHVYVTRAVYEVADDAEFTFEPIGEMRLRGWHRPLMVYQLVPVDVSFIDPGVFLMITDLHGLIPYSEKLSASEMHDWLLIWGDLHRQAVNGLRGRVRQFVADMALVTFTNPDDAVQGVLNLQALSVRHNESQSRLPPLQFKAAFSTGDLVLSPTGLVGRVVNCAFDLLKVTPRTSVCIDEATFQQLRDYQSRFERVSFTTPQGPIEAYQLTP